MNDLSIKTGIRASINEVFDEEVSPGISKAILQDDFRFEDLTSSSLKLT